MSTSRRSLVREAANSGAPEHRVLVIGAGLAGLCAALAAREAGAQVTVLEASSADARGGNSRFSNGSFRIAHDGIGHGGTHDLSRLIDLASQPHADRARVAPYSAADFSQDIQTTSRGRANPDELDLVVRESFGVGRWLAEHGVGWQLNLKFAHVGDLASGEEFDLDPGVSLAATDSGTGLVESLFAAAEAAGVEICYETVLDDFLVRGGEVVGARVLHRSRTRAMWGSVVLASGGFEANPEMRRKYLGPGWDLVAVRGSRHNTGRGLVKALDLGALPVGHWGGCHSVPTDAAIPLLGDLDRSPRSERYSYGDGLLVNQDGQRFIDEGEDDFTTTYTKVGAAIAAQPGGVAYQIFDARSSDNLHSHYYTHATSVIAESIEELACALRIGHRALQRTIHEFNQACRDGRETAPELRSAHPDGQPSKSAWADPVDLSPFVAYKVASGISFTYGGIATSSQMGVQHVAGHGIAGLYAAGGVVGGLFFHNYPAGAALTRGAVCGRLAGQAAAASTRLSRRDAPVNAGARSPA